MGKNPALARIIAITGILPCLSACVTTDQVMSALPSGTVVLYQVELPDPIPSGWGAWKPCPDRTFVRIQQEQGKQGHGPGEPFSGKSFSKTFWTSAAMTGTNYHWHASSDTTGAPAATGTDHRHSVAVSIGAGQLLPPAIDFACMYKP